MDDTGKQNSGSPRMSFTENGRLGWTTLVSLAIPYGFVLASIYLYAHWHPIGINPFQYANAADLTSATMGALVTFFVGGASGILLGILIEGKSVSSAGDATKISRGQLIFAVVSTVLIVSGIIAAWIFDFPFKFLGVGVVLYIVVIVRVRKIDLYYTIFPTEIHRRVIPLLAFTMPFGMIDMGTYHMRTILNSSTGNIADVSRSKFPVPLRGRVMYVGALGEFHVFREIDTASTVIVPAETSVVFKADRNL